MHLYCLKLIQEEGHISKYLQLFTSMRTDPHTIQRATSLIIRRARMCIQAVQCENILNDYRNI